MKTRIFQWMRQRKTLFHLAKRTQSAYIFFHNRLHADPNLLRRSPLARRTRIGAGTTTHPTAFVSKTGVRIGSRCTIGPLAVILPRSILEDDVEIGPGVIVGSQGFVNERGRRGTFSVKHTGGVRIGKGVRMCANSCVDRSTFRGRTVVGAGTNVGILAHVAHDVHVGSGCRILEHATISGRVKLGDGVVLGQNCTISHFVVIGDRAVVKDSAVVTKDVAAGRTVEGNFAIDSIKLRKFMRSVASGEVDVR